MRIILTSRSNLFGTQVIPDPVLEKESSKLTSKLDIANDRLNLQVKP